MTDLTNSDLARLITCVTIHDGINPYGLHRDTFDRLAKHGLVVAHYAEDEPDCPESYEITDLGRELVEAALERAREHIEFMAGRAIVRKLIEHREKQCEKCGKESDSPDASTCFDCYEGTA